MGGPTGNWLDNNIRAPLQSIATFNMGKMFQKPADPLPGILAQQQAQATQLQNQLLQQPKNISPDNFLATKASQLARLRLGMASTITGAGGAPSAVLTSPSLNAASAGKSKLGQ